jgi:hypothetical protein
MPIARRTGAQDKAAIVRRRGQRRIDVLELLRIVEALKGEPRAMFMDIVARRGSAKRRITYSR